MENMSVIRSKRGRFACIGNVIEHYDTALFGLLSPYFAHLLLPRESPETALLFIYMIMPLARVVAPVGALFFGIMGDLCGRRKALFTTLIGMGIVSAGMGCTPLYAHIGIWSPILFFLGRLLQNFFVSGEAVGGAVVFLEGRTGAGKRNSPDFLSGLYQSSTMLGITMASLAVVGVVTYCDWRGWDSIDPAWRLLYFIGVIVAFCGCVLRRIPEGNHPLSMSEERILSLRDFLQRFAEMCRYRTRELIAIIINTGFSYASYSIAFVLMNGFVPLVTSFSKGCMMRMHTALVIGDCFGSSPIRSYCSENRPRETDAHGGSIFRFRSPCDLFIASGLFFRSDFDSKLFCFGRVDLFGTHICLGNRFSSRKPIGTE